MEMVFRMKRLRVRRVRSFCIPVLGCTFAAWVCLLTSAAYAQDVDHSWVRKASANLPSELRHWRLTSVLGEAQDAPAKGDFALIGHFGGTARLVSDLSPPRLVKLTPVAKRVSYVRKGVDHTDREKIVTSDLIEALRSPEVAKFVDRKRLNGKNLDVEKNLSLIHI